MGGLAVVVGRVLDVKLFQGVPQTCPGVRAELFCGEREAENNGVPSYATNAESAVTAQQRSALGSVPDEFGAHAQLHLVHIF